MYSLGMNSLHISSGRQTEQYWYEVVRGQEKVRVLNSLRMFTGQMGINVKATLIAWVKTWRHGTAVTALLTEDWRSNTLESGYFSRDTSDGPCLGIMESSRLQKVGSLVLNQCKPTSVQ